MHFRFLFKTRGNVSKNKYCPYKYVCHHNYSYTSCLSIDTISIVSLVHPVLVNPARCGATALAPCDRNAYFFINVIMYVYINLILFKKNISLRVVLVYIFNITQ